MFGDNLDYYKELPVVINFVHDFDRVDYCLDTTDLKFCELMKISDFDLFEFVMDRLDKGWFKEKDKKLKKIEKILPSEVCDVCVRKETENDPILVCQGCAISVHRDCYGSCYSKEELFLCQCCIFYYLDHTCIFCGFTGGAMKMTNDFKFGHILCVIFDKTLDFDNPISKEPIYTGNYKLSQGTCAICKSKDDKYTRIECSYGICMTSYHLGCSIDKVYYDINNRISYCQLHDPSKSRNLFTSSASFKNLYSGYLKLKEKPLIRKKVPINEWKETEYIKLIKSDPVIPDSVYKKLSKIAEKDLLESICDYWLSKRNKDRRYGVSYLRHRVE
ncbi:hypothetical protein P3W45_000366 [Vairimorpha bombi]|jgi:NuA3 HAT complex component NTO1